MRSVGEIVRARLDSLRETGSWLERRLGLKHRGDVSKIINGKRSLPRKDIEAWISALELDDVAAREFRLAAHLQRTDPLVCEEFDSLKTERDGARSLVSDYATRVAIIRRLVDDLDALHPTEPPRRGGPRDPA